MGRACSIYGRQERCIQRFVEKTIRKRQHLEELGLDGRIILKWKFKSGIGNHEIDCGQIMKFQVL
jgi:hypothetical protein